MEAVRLRGPGLDALELAEVDLPRLEAGQALVRVHAAALTRGELEWPLDRLPAIPSYELAGVVEAVAPDVAEVAPGAAVIGLTPFDRDGVAAQYAAVDAAVLAEKPRALTHVESAALPLPGLSAWQGLFVHGRLRPGERVLVHGATGGVGQLAAHLAQLHGADVIGTTSRTSRTVDGGCELVDLAAGRFEEAVAPVDLVFDTVGGDVLARSHAVLRDGGRLVSVAEEAAGATYFVVQPDREQLAELVRLADEGALRPEIDSVFALRDARAAFERSESRAKRGKVVLRVVDE